MNPKKANILDLVPFTAALLLFGGLTATSVISGDIAPTLLFAALTALVIYAFGRAFRHGFRTPTRYEKFKAWMTVRPIMIGLFGVGTIVFVVIYLLAPMKDWTQEAKAALILPPVIILVSAFFYSLWRAPGRFEQDEQYKRRVGYKENE